MSKQIEKLNIYSTKEVCELLGLTDLTLTRYFREGIIISKKVGGKWLTTGNSLINYLECSYPKTDNPEINKD